MGDPGVVTEEVMMEDHGVVIVEVPTWKVSLENSRPLVNPDIFPTEFNNKKLSYRCYKHTDFFSGFGTFKNIPTFLSVCVKLYMLTINCITYLVKICSTSIVRET